MLCPEGYSIRKVEDVPLCQAALCFGRTFFGEKPFVTNGYQIRWWEALNCSSRCLCMSHLNSLIRDASALKLYCRPTINNQPMTSYERCFMGTEEFNSVDNVEWLSKALACSEFRLLKLIRRQVAIEFCLDALTSKFVQANSIEPYSQGPKSIANGRVMVVSVDFSVWYSIVWGDARMS